VPAFVVFKSKGVTEGVPAELLKTVLVEDHCLINGDVLLSGNIKYLREELGNGIAGFRIFPGIIFRLELTFG